MFPTQVLDMQADFALRMDDVRFRTVAIQSYGLDFGAPQTRTPAEHETVMNMARGLTDALRMQSRAAEAYRVTDDMSLLVQGVAAALDESDVFHRELAPAEVGLVRFDRPLPITDVRQRIMKAHYVWWGPVTVNGRPATLLTWFNDTHDPDEVGLEEDVPPEAGAVLGRWRWIGADIVFNGAGVGPDAKVPSAEQVAAVEAEGDVAGPTSNATRYAHALWTLLGQTITTLGEDPLDRAAKRRAKRMGIPGRVTVIQLRRTETSAQQDGESDVEWKHRWVQRQHLRWQNYGPQRAEHVHLLDAPVAEGGHMVRRCLHPGCGNYQARIVIPACVKGPDGAPLRIAERVHNVTR